MKILFSVLILFGLALIFSVLLAYLGHKLSIPVDEKESFVRSKLSGANCGGCGYAGCDDFARALCDGRAAIKDCTSTSIENKKLIAERLGQNEAGEEIKLVVCCAGGSDSLDKYDYLGYGDCRTVAMLAGGRKICDAGCLGMGVCVANCPTKAMQMMERGYPEIAQHDCIHCGVCKKLCPKGLIRPIPADAKVYVACSSHKKGKDVRSFCPKGCIGCGSCARVCPEQAVTVQDNLAVIDYSKCVGCGKCAQKCPTKAIRLLQDSVSPAEG